jgi:hypothetical protein
VELGLDVTVSVGERGWLHGKLESLEEIRKIVGKNEDNIRKLESLPELLQLFG